MWMDTWVRGAVWGVFQMDMWVLAAGWVLCGAAFFGWISGCWVLGGCCVGRRFSDGYVGTEAGKYMVYVGAG